MKTLVLTAVIILCGLVQSQEPVIPNWVDANQVTGVVTPVELLLGDTQVVTARQPDPNYVAEWKLFGIVPDNVSIDVNIPNEASFVFEPNKVGTEYVKYKSRISVPYKGRVRINTIAFRTRNEPLFSVEWFYLTIPPIGEGEPIPW